MGVLTRRAAARCRSDPEHTSSSRAATAKETGELSPHPQPNSAAPSPAGTDDEHSAHSCDGLAYDSDYSRSECADSGPQLASTNEEARKAVETVSQSSNKQSSQLALLALFATGICSCYCCYGIVQERLFSRGSGQGDAIRGVGPITTFMILTQTVTNGLVALIWIWVDRNILRRGGGDSDVNNSDAKKGRAGLNHPLLLLTAFCYFAAMAGSNEALNHVSYPTVVLAKSSKLIPTMLAGVVLERRSYSLREWAGALLITSGIIIFNWSRMADRANTPGSGGGDSPYGLALLLFSLAMDGALASCQGALKRHGHGAGTSPGVAYRPPSAIELMLWTNVYSSLFLLPASALSGQLSNGLNLLTQTGEGATSARQWICVLNATAASGQIFIFMTIHCFSSLMCTTITTTRKFFTILLSVRNFGHVFSAVQWSAVLMVFGGLYIEIAAKLGGGIKRRAAEANSASKEVLKKND